MGYSKQLPPASHFRFTCTRKVGHTMYYDSVSLRNDKDPRFNNAMIVWKKKYINPGFNFSTTGKIINQLRSTHTAQKMKCFVKDLLNVFVQCIIFMSIIIYMICGVVAAFCLIPS